MNERNDEGAVLPLGLNLGIWDRMTSWDEVIEIARLADELGYDCLLIPESFGRDGVTLCDRLLAATSRIKVCFGIANVFSRSPAVLASTAATLDELSGGRFILGPDWSSRRPWRVRGRPSPSATRYGRAIPRRLKAKFSAPVVSSWRSSRCGKKSPSGRARYWKKGCKPAVKSPMAGFPPICRSSASTGAGK
jgi:hypothetical protein